MSGGFDNRFIFEANLCRIAALCAGVAQLVEQLFRKQ